MKYRLGDLIQLSDEKNNDNKFKEKDVRGISNKKEFIETKANLYDVSLKPYLLVKPDYFSYVTITSRNGNKISIAHNTTNETYLVSSSYIVFYIKEPKILLSDYLFMIFNRIEFDRESRYNSWGSAREAFSWDDMCDIELNLPSVKIQQKYIEIYNALIENQKVYEKGAKDLKLVCDGYIENLRRNIQLEQIGEYIEEVNIRNRDLLIKNVQGVENTHSFIETRANTSNLDFSNYKIVDNNWFAYNPARINIGSIALRQGEKCIISPMYTVFKTSNEEKLLSKYLMLWFSREEFKHYTKFYSFGSVRDTFEYNLMKEVEIPIPTLKAQQDIVNIYEVYNKRKSIAEKLKEEIKNICPVLIAGAIKEGEKSNG